MANVYIRIGTDESDKRPAKVVVDGVDMTEHVLAAGFAVQMPAIPGEDHAVVTMRIRADRLEMDLPQSVLDATAVECAPRPIIASTGISAQAVAREVDRLNATGGVC